MSDEKQKQREAAAEAVLRALRVRYPGRPVHVEWNEQKPATEKDEVRALVTRQDALLHPSRDPEPPYIFPGPSVQWKGAEGDYAQVLLRDPCSYCGEFADDRAVDHIIPRRHDGEHHWSNLTATCRSCNASKGAKRPAHFMLRRIA